MGAPLGAFPLGSQSLTLTKAKSDKPRFAWIEIAAACSVIALAVGVVRFQGAGVFAPIGNDVPPNWLVLPLVASTFFLFNSLKIAGILVLATAVLGLLLRKGRRKNALWVFSWKRFLFCLLALYCVPLICGAILYFNHSGDRIK